MSGLDVNRREFLKIAAGASAALALPTPTQAAVIVQNDRYTNRSHFVCG